MTLAILCSGQGWQGPDMFALTGDALGAAGLFSHTARLLGGRDPRLVVREETLEAVHRNRKGQILCALQALAAIAALQGVLPQHLIVAGYSIGELAAWGVAGFLDSDKVLDLAAARAEAMDAASPPGDGLMFVRGLPRETLDRLCARHGVDIAIMEPDNAFVLGGARTGLASFADEARLAGAGRIVDLAVEVASHTGRLREASAAFRKILAQSRAVGAPVGPVRLISGIDGMPVMNLSAGLEKLARQISEPVQWGACLQSCGEAGASAFLELGPGRALSRMAAGEFTGTPARSMDDFQTLEGVRTWVSHHGAL